jgi:hypothetical protein
MKDASCTVLVTSCDAYRDVEGPFITLFRKYWPDCPFEVVLLTETARPGEFPQNAFDRVIATGKGKTWSQMLVEALGQIGTPYVIMEMNDCMPCAPIDTANLLRRMEQMKEIGAANLRLIPLPPGRRPWGGTDLLEAPKNTAYCVSCQVGIWEHGYLRGIARRTRSAWEFERHGSFLVGDEPRPILVTPEREFFDVDTVHKGYWVPAGVKLLRDNGIPRDEAARGMGTFAEHVREGVKKALFTLLPATFVVKVQNLFDGGPKETPR